MGARQAEYSPAKLADLGMASNCYVHGNDPNDATHLAQARCRSMYDMKNPAGEAVRNYNMTFGASLVTCDVSNAGMPQLEEDLRKVAMHNASHVGLTIEKPEHLACDISVIPRI